MEAREDLNWCIERALAAYDRAGVSAGVASFMGDVKKKAGTRHLGTDYDRAILLTCSATRAEFEKAMRDFTV